MSRGLSQQQRAILAILEDAGEDGGIVLELAKKIHDVQSPTPAQYESVRRAVRSLARRGLVVQAPGVRYRTQVIWSDGISRWHNCFLSVGQRQGRRLSNTYRELEA